MKVKRTLKMLKVQFIAYVKGSGQISAFTAVIPRPISKVDMARKIDEALNGKISRGEVAIVEIKSKEVVRKSYEMDLNRFLEYADEVEE